MKNKLTVVGILLALWYVNPCRWLGRNRHFSLQQPSGFFQHDNG